VAAVTRRPVRRVLAILSFCLVLSWLATPVLAYAGMITAAPFFGELPTPDERAESTRLALLAGFTAFVAPALAAITSGRSPLRTVALIELGISGAAVAALLLYANR
jgi:hypothetical protein